MAIRPMTSRMMARHLCESLCNGQSSHQAQVIILEPPHHRRSAVFLLNPPASFEAELFRERRIVEQSLDPCCKRMLIIWRNQQPVNAVLDQFHIATDGGSDNRLACCHVFQEGVGHSLGAGTE